MKAGWGKALLSALPVVQLLIPPLSSPLHIGAEGRGKGRGLTLNFPSADWSFCLLPGDAWWQLWGSRETGARHCQELWQMWSCLPHRGTRGLSFERRTDLLPHLSTFLAWCTGNETPTLPFSSGQQQGQGTLDYAWTTNQESPSNAQPGLPYLQPSNHSFPWHVMSSAVERLELISFWCARLYRFSIFWSALFPVLRLKISNPLPQYYLWI